MLLHIHHWCVCVPCQLEQGLLQLQLLVIQLFLLLEQRLTSSGQSPCLDSKLQRNKEGMSRHNSVGWAVT